MLKLFNTLSRRKEDFIPLSSKAVTMYSCGPTVYNFAHIGNLRTYIFMDLLRKTLKYNGFKLKGVLNITDVGHLLSDADEGEDKMAKSAREQNKSPYEIAAYYTEVFFADIAKLNIGKPEIIAKATDHIKEMQDYVEQLFDKGYAYETSDGIYFDIEKFSDYGKLSGINLEEQLSGARVEVNSEKHNPADFALWKKAPKEHIMQWPGRWGMGYPGWHIECSAMSKKYLGKVFDIHTGGVDHIPIHHENEIAQSEALEGCKTVNYWLHGEFMQVDGGKMSKSLKNTYTVADLEKRGYSPLDFRYFCLNAHYRKKLNFTFEGMDAAKVSYERLQGALYQHKNGTNVLGKEKYDSYLSQFEEAVNDDLNIPLALGVLWTMVKEPKSKEVFELAVKMDSIFGLGLKDSKPQEEAEERFSDEIIAIAEERLQARKDKNWAKSDELRNRLAALGVQMVDTADGYKLKGV